MNNQIRLKHIQVTDLVLNVKKFNKDVTNKLDTSLGFETGFSGESQTDFAIIFDIGLQNGGDFILKIKATAHFETDDIIDEEFKNSAFLKISAPAIAFPYLRAFISNLTLNSGYEAIILPSFNFIKMSEEKEIKKEF